MALDSTGSSTLRAAGALQLAGSVGGTLNVTNSGATSLSGALSVNGATTTSANGSVTVNGTAGGGDSVRGIRGCRRSYEIQAVVGAAAAARYLLHV